MSKSDIGFLSTYKYKNINGEVVFKKSVLLMWGNPVYVEGWYKNEENKWRLDYDAFISENARNKYGHWVGKKNEVKLMLFNIENVKEAILQGKKIIFVENEYDVTLLNENGYFCICLSKFFFEEKELCPLLQVLQDGDVYIVKQFIQKLVKKERKKQVTKLLKILLKISNTVNEVDLQYENSNYKNITDIFFQFKTEEEALEEWKKILENSKKLK